MRTNQFTSTVNNPIMPLLMACTKPSRIQEAEEETPMMYDPMTQRIGLDMRTVGTRSLRSVGTRVKINSIQTSSKSDKKNEIDDQKNVK